jgi:hypothetical protein
MILGVGLIDIFIVFPVKTLSVPAIKAKLLATDYPGVIKATRLSKRKPSRLFAGQALFASVDFRLP